MDVLRIVLVVFHFVGIAALLGSFIVELKDVIAGRGRVLVGMLHGSLTMLVTGLGLYLVHMVEGGELNHMKLGVKTLVLVVITALVLIFRKKDPAPSWALWLIGGLALLNVIIAVAW